MKHIGRLMSALLLALLAGGQVYAQTPEPNTIIVEHPWARATPAGAKTGATYVTLINNRSSGDRLLSATTPVAEKVQFHRVTEEDGVSRMREMRTAELPPGASVTFNPGGMHIMLVGLREPLKEGQTFPLTLVFEKAGKVEATVSTAKVGAMQHGDLGAGGTMKK